MIDDLSSLLPTGNWENFDWDFYVRSLSSNWQEIVGLRVTLYDADGPARSFSGFSV